MRCDIILTLALLVANRSDPIPAPQMLRPPSSAPIPSSTPAAVPAPSVATPKTPEPTPSPKTPAPVDAASMERLTTFDAASADLNWSFKGWQLLADGAALKDFGRSEWEARQALRLIRELGLNQHGVIGGPNPSLEYWLSHGEAPRAPKHGLAVPTVDSARARRAQ